MQLIETGMRLNGRARSRGRPKHIVIAAPRRSGRVITQTRRAFIASGGRPLSMTELRQWCFAGRERRHWHYWSITRALRRLGAISLGRAGRAGVWANPLIRKQTLAKP
jgi:hypothetical protein